MLRDHTVELATIAMRDHMECLVMSLLCELDPTAILPTVGVRDLRLRKTVVLWRSDLAEFQKW